MGDSEDNSTTYLVLLLLAQMARAVWGPRMPQPQQQPQPMEREQGEPGPDPRRPLPPTPIPPRPRPPPPPPQPPQPPPPPPAGPHWHFTTPPIIGVNPGPSRTEQPPPPPPQPPQPPPPSHARPHWHFTTPPAMRVYPGPSRAEQEYVMDADPHTPQPGNPATEAGTSKCESSASVGEYFAYQGKLYYRDKRPHHVTDQNGAATKRMKVEDESQQQATQAQDSNRSPTAHVSNGNFLYNGIVGLMTQIARNMRASRMSQQPQPMECEQGEPGPDPRRPRPPPPAPPRPRPPPPPPQPPQPPPSPPAGPHWHFTTPPVIREYPGPSMAEQPPPPPLQPPKPPPPSSAGPHWHFTTPPAMRVNPVPSRPERPPPPPPQPLQPPPPPPPSGPQWHFTTPPAMRVYPGPSRPEREYVMDADPHTPQPGNPATEAGTSKCESSASVGEYFAYQGKLYYRDKRPHQVTDQNDAATKRMKVEDVSQQQATQAQFRSSRKNASDESEPTFNSDSEDSTDSAIPDTEDYQNARSHDDAVIEETDSDHDDGIEDSETNNNFHCGKYVPRIYVDAQMEVYRRLENVDMVAAARESKEKCENTDGPPTAPRVAPVESRHSQFASLPAADKTSGIIPPVPPAPGLALQRGESSHMEPDSTHQNSTDVSVKTPYNSKLDSSATKHLDCTVGQERALHRTLSLPKGTEQQLPGRPPQQQRETSDNALVTGRVLRGIPSRLPSQTPVSRASAPSPLGHADGRRGEQSKAASVVTAKPHRKLETMDLGAVTEGSVHTVEKLRNTGIFAIATSAGGAQSPRSVVSATPAADNATELSAKQKGRYIASKSNTAQGECSAKCVPSQCNLKRGSFTPEDPDATVSQSRATQRDHTQLKEGEQQHCGHLPQQKRGTSNAPSTAAPFGLGGDSHLAPQTRRAATSAPPPFGGVGGNRNAQPGTATATMQLQNQELQAGQQNQQQLNSYMITHRALISVPRNMELVGVSFTVTCQPSAHTEGVGYNVNQQPVVGTVPLQNPPGDNLTAATLQGRQAVPACRGTPGNSKNENDGNSNNQTGAAVLANNRPLLPGMGSRPPEASNSQPTGQRGRGGGDSEEHRQPDKAPDASCQKDGDAHSPM